MSDPRLIMSASGTRLQFTSGQPLMDEGLENLALISLFTSPGWCGNKFLKVPIGSDFEQTCNQPITRQSLNAIRNAAERALINPVFGTVKVAVSNPVSHRLDIVITLGSGIIVLLSRMGQNWQFQSSDPAYIKIRPAEYVSDLVVFGGESTSLNGRVVKW